MIVHMIGNAHIDPVWLWNWQVGSDEVLATYRSAADRCDEYPEFIFTRGEAWCYRQVEEIDPALFARVRKHIENGQWHITGGQWIQPDVNLPTREGLRRQMIHGRAYFKDRFGVTPNVGYNVDSFGHPATLPDLLAEMGYLGYVFHRPDQKQTPVPACTFRWIGPGGGEVLGFRIPAPYTTRSDDLYGQIMLSLDEADEKIGHVMCFYGVGNHGGGPTKGNIEYILNHRDAFAGAQLVFSTPQRFFEAVAPRRDQLPTVDFELQKTFPGCYVAMQEIKRQQRHNEHLLQQALSAVEQFADADQQRNLRQKIDLAWEDLLFTEFHDILAGTSIPDAWPGVRAMQGRARIIGEEVMHAATRRFARTKLPPINHQQMVLLNPGDVAFDGYVEHEPFTDFHAWGNRWIAEQSGEPIAYQQTRSANGIMTTPAIVFRAQVPAGSAKVLVLRDDAQPTPPPTTDQRVHVEGLTIRNDRLSVQLCDTGIAAIDHAGRSMLGQRGWTLRLRDDTADTWGFQIKSFTGAVATTLHDCRWRIDEAGPLRARAVAEAMIGRSPVRLQLQVYADRPDIDLRLDVRYCERFKLLQMPLHLPQAPRRWRCGLSGGAIDREPGETEWPLHGWSRAGDLAVLCHDANSVSLNQDELTWSLARATRQAWAGGGDQSLIGGHELTDQGALRFDIKLLPLAEPISDAALHDIADRLIRPLMVFDRYDGMNRPPWGSVTPRYLWTPAEHRARKDGHLADWIDDGRRAPEEPK